MRSRYCWSMPVLPAASLKKSLTCSRKRGSLFSSSFGPNLAAKAAAGSTGLDKWMRTCNVRVGQGLTFGEDGWVDPLGGFGYGLHCGLESVSFILTKLILPIKR